MRWPLRNQILLPYVLAQSLTILTLAFTSSWQAVHRVEADIEGRLASVASTLAATNYPLSEPILLQLHDLSGAHFVVFGRDDRLRQSTVSDFDWNSPTAVLSDAQTHEISRVRDRRVLLVAGEPYFANQIQRTVSGQTEQILILYSRDAWSQARSEAMWPPLIIGGVLLILGGLVAYLISRRLGGRVQALQMQVSRIAGQNFAPASLPGTDDELRDLTSDINRMGQLLEESLRLVGEQTKSQILTQLVGGLSHQFRNAITGGRISVQLHQRRCSTPEDSALDVALKQLQLTEEQIKSLLRVARGQPGSARHGQFADVLREVIDLVEPLCSHQRVELMVTSAAVVWPVKDLDAMRALMLNLVLNAIEAAGPQGKVEIRTHQPPGQLLLEVLDDGAPPAQPDRMFELFHTTKPEGVGLGLFLARQIAEENNGTLTFERRDSWTVFRMVLNQDASA